MKRSQREQLRVLIASELLIVTIGAGAAQTDSIRPVRHPVSGHDSLVIRRYADPAQPFTVAGDHGAILGKQDGTFEAWIFPVKVISHFHIEAVSASDEKPLDVNQKAASIEVTPARTTITYLGGGFDIRQRMFAAQGDPAGIVTEFEIEANNRFNLKFCFTPELVRMWPVRETGAVSADWVQKAQGGYFLLRRRDLNIVAAVGMPNALPASVAHSTTCPAEFEIPIEPAKRRKVSVPLLMIVSDREDAIDWKLSQFNDRIVEMFRRTERYYRRFFDDKLTVDTPDAALNEAVRWAEIAIDKGRVDFHGETGLVAGYGASGDSERPGYAWFFGRDTLWSSFAIDSYGDFALTRKVLDFLIRRQRADGKIMHEFSQTADLVNWGAMPYYYAAADSTPLFVMAMEDYINVSGDLAFLHKNWNAVKSAYAFTRAHTDANGIYQNGEGTGWVESWPTGLPQQEMYLAALDQQSSGSMSRLADLMRDRDLATSAKQTSEQIRMKLETQFYDPALAIYAFSRNRDGTLDKTATIFPAVAWWSGRLSLTHSEHMLSRWAAEEFSTDWGVRDVSNREAIYDPVSYHQGSVWPLFTGWVALAEYRTGRDLAGFSHLMENADLTWAQDPGVVTELLSGDVFQPLERSTAHQIWSSAMVLTPALRGLFGLNWDALRETLRVAPRLPATWGTSHDA